MRGFVLCRLGPSRQPRASLSVLKLLRSLRPCLRHPLRSWWAAPLHMQEVIACSRDMIPGS